MPTFAVSDVPRETTPLPPVTFAASVARRVASPYEAGAANLGDLVTNRIHPFVEAAHHAFASHYPLVLSPDDVWLCLAQAFATHVEADAEALRSFFVRHEGKVMIELRRDGFRKGAPGNDWPGAFGEYSDRLAEHLGKKRDLVVASFSTTGPVERAASEIVLLSAMRHYFEYGMMSMCGIPEVTLLGTVADWRSIRARAAVFAEIGLGAWTEALLPVLDELVRAAEGRANAELWRSFYKAKDASGGPYVNGWINVLFPFVGAARGGAPSPNPAMRTWAKDFSAPFGGGPRPEEFPSGLSVAPFTWNYLGTKFPMELVAGFVGVSQEPRTLAVRPAIGWVVRDAAEAAT